MASNETERRRWGDKQIVAAWPKREQLTDTVTPHVLAAIQLRPGQVVLDIGCGGGKTTIAIAHAVKPRGRVVGADISKAMLSLASKRAREAKVTNATFVARDMQTGKVAGGPFDAATSQFGVMFFEEPLAAFKNIRKHLKKGGRIAFACWQPAPKNAWFPGAAIAPFAPAPPPPAPGTSPTGPFALGDARYVRALLKEAGFADVTRKPKRVIVNAPLDAIGDTAIVTIMGVPQSKQKQATAALEKHLARFAQPDGNGRFELNFQVFSARNP
ncbi:MAG: class I SAM-dependent methyltransferase [Dehalococcoidia bacterium]